MARPWSFVVPVGPGDEAWRGLIEDLAAAPASCERLLVFAAGHAPDPVPAGVRWIEAPAGRALQLNAGLAGAAHPLVCLLHADSRIPARSLAALVAFEPGADELGYFDLRFHDGPWPMAFNRWGTWVRSRLLGMPFGDQGFAASASLFQRLGGFDPAIGPGEDHALVWRLRQANGRLVPLRAPISTSARRYVDHGWWRTTWRFGRMTWRQARAFSRARMPR